MKTTLVIAIFLALGIFGDIGLCSYLSPQNYYDSSRHVFLSSTNTNWDFFGPEDQTSQTTSKDQALQFVARSPYIISGGLQPTLTLRIDKAPFNSARSYGERWLKDFPKYGYELQMSRDSTFGSLKGFEIELSATKSNREIRQLIVKSKDEFLVFTCTSDQKHFSISWAACEKILKSSKVN